MDRSSLRAFTEKLKPKLEELAKETGYSVQLGRGTYSDTNATLKLEIAEENEDGDVMTENAEAFKIYAPTDGIPADLLFQPVVMRGKPAKFIGYTNFVYMQPRARKMPYLVKTEEGTYKITATHAKSIAKAAGAAV